MSKTHIYLDGCLSLLVFFAGWYLVWAGGAAPEPGLIQSQTLLGGVLVPLGATWTFWTIQRLREVREFERDVTISAAKRIASGGE